MKAAAPMITIVVIVLIAGSILSIEYFVNKSFDPPAENVKDIVSDKEGKFPRAKELTGISGYINTEGKQIKLSDYENKVILVDFWTYTCINCIRTLPYLKAWHEEYNSEGLVIIGVHTPEFEFEKDYDNVVKAAQKYQLEYPIVQDNNYQTWRAYQNQYWPRKYLIDVDGFIRYDHIGEGGYDETEQKIKELLEEAKGRSLANKKATPSGTTPVDYRQINTPELYLGYAFARAPLANPENFKPEQQVTYTRPVIIPKNIVALEGTWKNNKDDMELVSDEGTVTLSYTAKVVNIVASATQSTLTILLNNEPLTDVNKGSDVVIENGQSIIEANREDLYNVVTDTGYHSKTITIKAKGPGFKLSTFTFG